MEDTVTIRIPAELKEALLQICEAEGSSLSIVVRNALKKLISLHQFETLRAETIPHAEKSGVYTDEDILDLPS